VVCRIGVGTANFSDPVTLHALAVPVFLDEYTPTGQFVRSISLPTSLSGNNKRLVMAPLTSFGTDEGTLTRSADHRYLAITGYNAMVGTDEDILRDGTTIARTIGIIDNNGNINTTTALTDAGNFSPRGAITSNGSDIWSCGIGGLRYTTVGNSTSIQIHSSTGFRKTAIENGQLYGTVTNGNIIKLGAGLPTTGPASIAILPGIATNGATCQFVFADLNPTIPGNDVLYVANILTPALTKYSLVGNTWTSNGKIGVDTDHYDGITAVVSGTSVKLFATRRFGFGFSAPGTGELITLTDNTGYNSVAGAFAALPITVLATAAPNTVIRGVAMTPIKCKTPILGLGAITPTSAQIFVTDSVTVGGPYEYEISTSNTPSGSGTSTNSNIIISNTLSPGVHYYTHVRRNCGGGDFSEWTTLDFFTFWPPCTMPVIQNPVVTGNNSITISWQTVFTAARYEYAITGSATPPASGISTTAISNTISGLSSTTSYYLHVRAHCGGGDTSAWASKLFTTPCFGVSPFIIKNDISTGTAELGWYKIKGTIQYEYAVLSTPASPGASTAFTSDTILNVTDLHGGGKYYLHIRAHCGESNVSTWSILEFHTSGVHVYPNPSSDIITIRVFGQGSSANLPISIYSSQGQLMKHVMMTNNQVSVDIQKWSAGIYFVRYGNEKGYVTTIMKR
jgi:hypothetical protein